MSVGQVSIGIECFNSGGNFDLANGVIPAVCQVPCTNNSDQ